MLMIGAPTMVRDSREGNFIASNLDPEAVISYPPWTSRERKRGTYLGMKREDIALQSNASFTITLRGASPLRRIHSFKRFVRFWNVPTMIRVHSVACWNATRRQYDETWERLRGGCAGPYGGLYVVAYLKMIPRTSGAMASTGESALASAARR